MQYLMMDIHQRFIGTLNHKEPLAVGDIFKTNNAKTYTVVSVDLSNRTAKNMRSVTVIARNAPLAAK